MQRITELLHNLQRGENLIKYSETIAESTKWERQYSSIFDYILKLLRRSLGDASIKDTIEIDTDSPEGKASLYGTVSSLFQLLNSVLNSLPENRLIQADLKLWESFYEELYGLTWNSGLYGLSKGEWETLRNDVNGYCITLLRNLMKLCKSSIVLPVFFRILGILERNNKEVQVEYVKMLRSLCEYTGSIAENSVLEYLNNTQLVEKLVIHLREITSQENVKLGFAKIMRTKKPGNSHQRRSQKINMRKSETKKLFNISTKSTLPTDSFSISLTKASLKLLSDFIISSPSNVPDLKSLFSITISSMPAEILPDFIHTLFNYSFTSRQYIHKLKLILSSLKYSDMMSSSARYCKIYADLFLLTSP